MKIVVVSNYRIGSETGVARVSEELSKTLSKNNKVLYLCLGKKFLYKKSRKSFDRLEIPSLPVKNGYVPKLSPEIVDKIFSNLDNFSPDIIHVQNIVFAALIALVWAKRNKIPYLITFHSLPSEGAVWMFPKMSKNKVVSTIDLKITSSYVRKFIKESDGVIALNEPVEKSIRKVYSKANIIRLNNGIDLDSFNKLKVTKPSSSLYFTYLGSYLSKKNQKYLVQTFKYLPENYHLSLFGKIDSGKSYVKELKKIISNNNQRNVDIEDFLNYKKVLKQLEKTHYFVSASLKEVQSLVVIEALASGTPVIALENETTKEIINGKNGLLLPANTSIEEFAKKLKSYVVQNNQNYEALANVCRKSVTKFEIATVTKKLENVYRTSIIIKNKQPKITNGDFEQLLELIPTKYKNIIEYELLPKIEKRKPSTLKFLVYSSVVASLIASGVLYLDEYVKKLKRSI